jgi:hypothetical protein
MANKNKVGYRMVGTVRWRRLFNLCPQMLRLLLLMMMMPLDLIRLDGCQAEARLLQ